MWVSGIYQQIWAYANLLLLLLAIIAIAIYAYQWCKQRQEVKTVDMELREINASSAEVSSIVQASEATEELPVSPLPSTVL